MVKLKIPDPPSKRQNTQQALNKKLGTKYYKELLIRLENINYTLGYENGWRDGYEMPDNFGTKRCLKLVRSDN